MVTLCVSVFTDVLRSRLRSVLVPEATAPPTSKDKRGGPYLEVGGGAQVEIGFTPHVTAYGGFGVHCAD